MNARRYRCEVYVDILVDDKHGREISDEKIQTLIRTYVLDFNGTVKDKLGNKGRVANAFAGDIVDLPFGDLTGGRKI